MRGLAVYLLLPVTASCGNRHSVFAAPPESHASGEADCVPTQWRSAWMVPAVRRLPSVDGLAGEAQRGESLNDAWAYAAATDLELEAARLMVLAQTDRVKAARALRSPNLSIGSSYSVRSDEQSVITPAQPPFFAAGTFPFVQDEGALLGGVVNVPVYAGGRISSSIRAAKCGESSAAQAAQRIKQELKLLVAADFLAVLEAERIVHTTTTSLESLEEHLKNVEQLQRNDLASPSDVLNARTATADARQRCLHAKNDHSLAIAQYNRRLGRPLSSPVHLQEPQLAGSNLSLQSLLNAALAKRPELLQMSFEVEVLRQKADAIRALDRPQVFVNGTYWFEENRYRTPEGIGSLGVTALWNIYDGRHDAYDAAALLQEAQALDRSRSALAQDIELEIHRAWLKRDEEERLIAELADSVQLSEVNSNNVRQRYQVGMATNAEVLAAEAAKVQTLERLYRARYTAILMEIKLRTVAGVL